MREGKRRARRRSSFALSRAILMRRTCYMEWNKGVAVEKKGRRKMAKKVASWREKEERRRAEY